MANYKSQNVRITNSGEVQKALEGVPQAIKNRALKKAVNEVCGIVARSAKAKAPKQSGLLRKSINRKVKQYPSGVVVGLVGPTTDSLGIYRGQRRNPHKYAHLVELGVAAHRMPKRSYKHKGAKAKPFLTPAFNENVDRITNIILDRVEEEINKEINKKG